MFRKFKASLSQFTTMTSLDDHYKQLLEHSKELAVVSSAGAILQWDMETKMPPRAVEQRSQQLALIYRLIHKLGTAPEIGKLSTSILKSPQYEMLSSRKTTTNKPHSPKNWSVKSPNNKLSP